MRKIFRARNVVLLLLALPIVLLVAFCVEFAYRTNSCAPGDHVIQSEEDAIEVAKKKIVKSSYFSSESFGSAPDFVDSLSETEGCCSATRSRTPFFVIVWEVSLSESVAKPNYRLAKVFLSNCGVIFTRKSYIDPR